MMLWIVQMKAITTPFDNVGSPSKKSAKVAPLWGVQALRAVPTIAPLALPRSFAAVSSHYSTSDN